MSLFLRFLQRHISDRRKPDFVIGDPDRPYMRRWWVIPRNRWFNIYLHQILRSDDDHALHDHPWINCSIILAGSYIEYTPRGEFWRRAGSIVFRLPSSLHRLALIHRPSGIANATWSLFIAGPVVREWGFQCPQGWRHWKVFTSPANKGQIGRGCGE